MTFFRHTRGVTLAAAAAIFALGLTPSASPQISIGVNVGPTPSCPYGYYGYTPYNCAPYGYYGPEWFGSGGLFIGAGPWYRGHGDFYGHVDRRYDPRFGYNGPFPEHGDQRFNHFHGNEVMSHRGEYRSGPPQGGHSQGGGQHDNGGHGDHH